MLAVDGDLGVATPFASRVWRICLFTLLVRAKAASP
jgi:hypothetical protein